MRILLIIILLFSLTSCDKEKHTSKKLVGTWELQEYKVTYTDGISEYSSGPGEMVIKASDFESYNNEFTLNVQMNFQSLVGILNEKGYMRLRDGENYDASLRDSNNAEYALEDHRIMVLNSTDLQITYKDAQEKFNSLTFRKKK